MRDRQKVLQESLKPMQEKETRVIGELTTAQGRVMQETYEFKEKLTTT